MTLTFHFWSGTQITYHLTKAGTAVTGNITSAQNRAAARTSGLSRGAAVLAS